MPSRLLVAALAALFLAVSAFAQTLPDQGDLRRHIEILASDRFQGRRPGTIGEAMAAHYIAAQFAQAGLQPGNAGSFYQAVPLIERRMDDVTLEWARIREGRRDRTIAIGEDTIAAIGRESAETVDAPIVFVGFGDPAVLERTLVSGAAVILLPGRPAHVGEFPGYRDRVRALAEMGAAAVFGVSVDGPSWRGTQQRYRNGRGGSANRPMAPVEGAVLESRVIDWLERDGIDTRSLETLANDTAFEPIALRSRLRGTVTSQVHRYNGYNVIGRLEGSGDTAENVMFLAHYDHFGVCRPPGSEDRICNGAIDNASGTAAIIEIASNLGEGERPARDIIFMATTAEEMGLLGADYFAEHPTIPLETIVAALNLDTIAISGTGAPVGIVGRGETPLDPVIDAAARQLGRPIDASDDMNAFIQRQDGWAFVRRGVPAIMAGGSFTDLEALNAFFNGDYHGPGDELSSEVPLGGALEDIWLHIALGRILADPSRFTASTR